MIFTRKRSNKLPFRVFFFITEITSDNIKDYWSFLHQTVYSADSRQTVFQKSVTATAAVVLIAATAAVVLVVTASVIAGENENEDDEENPITVASVTKKHISNLLSLLSIP